MSKKQNVKPVEVQSTEKPKNQDIYGWIGLIALILVIFICYSPAKTHEFVNWDDQVYVETQPLVLNKDYGALWKTPISLNYHPLTMISLAAQAPKKSQKLSAAPFISFNIWLHIFNTILCYLFIFTLTNKRWGVALFVAAIFALHPMHVESVAWVSERKDVLYTFFFLGGLITYLKYKETQKMMWIGLTLLLFVCSVLSKAMAVVFPMVLLLIDYYKGDDMTQAKTYLRHALFFAISLFFGLMAIDVQSGGDFHGILSLPVERSAPAVAAFETFSLGKRLLIACVGSLGYIKGFFYPSEISAFYPYPTDYKFDSPLHLMTPLIVLGLLGLGIWANKKSKAPLFGMLFFGITIALVLQFLSVGLALMADRYTYLPFIGIAFILAVAGSDFIIKKSDNQLFSLGLPVLGLIFVAMLTFKTKSQVSVWKNSETLWTQVLEYHPTEDLALANRGNYRGKSGRIEDAIIDFEKAISDGCNRADVYEGLGNSYGSLTSKFPDKKDEYVTKAKAMYSKALEIEPNNANVRYNLGIAQLQTDPAAALTAFQAFYKLAPHKELEVLPMIGLCLLNTAKYQEAIDTLTLAMTKGINTDAVYYYRGLANMGLGKNSMAILDLKQAVTINPQNADARAKLQSLGQ